MRRGRSADGVQGIGAGNGVRTRDLKLGKLALYQLSYARAVAYAIDRNARVSTRGCQPRPIRDTIVRASASAPAPSASIREAPSIW
jgi:hypothetical protein